jgi:hypothetical protein
MISSWSRFVRLVLGGVLLLYTALPQLLSAQREVIISKSATRLFDTPFYLSVPLHAWLEDQRLKPGSSLPSGDPIIRLPANDLDSNEVALRLLVMHDNENTRRTAAKKLFEAGLLKDGDVVLTFHPGWANTMPYPHIQMGISHTGTIFTKDDKAFNIDMPLDEEFNGHNLTGQLNSSHYLHTETIHVVRPHSFSDEQKANLRLWVQRLRSNYGKIRNEALLPFNSDYLSPRYAAFGITPLDSVVRFGNVIQGRDESSPRMAMYCSEFAWHLLTLSNQPPLNNQSPQKAALNMIFKPKSFVRNGTTTGLAEGPLLVLQAAANHLTASQKNELIDRLFTVGDAASLSSGHRDVARSVQPQMAALKPYYTMILAANQDGSIDSSDDISAVAAQLNATMRPNFSPTSFLVNTFLQKDDSERSFDYLYTLTFTTDAGYDKARQIAKQQANPN